MDPKSVGACGAPHEQVEAVGVMVRGRVQGVGFRWWTRARALEAGVEGFARNLDNGAVEVHAQGRPQAVSSLVALLAVDPVPPGRPGQVRSCVVRDSPVRGDLAGFREL